MVKNLVKSILVLLAISHILIADASPVKVRVQLKWLHQFQFAGYYMALEKGFYRNANLDVEILEGGMLDGKYLDNMLDGKTEFAVVSSGVIIDRMKGKPVVALAAITQTSPGVLFVRADSNIRSPLDLTNKRMEMFQSAEIIAMLHKEGVDLSKINTHPQNVNSSLDDLINGKTDAEFGYITDASYQLNKKGLAFRVINPLDYGVNLYNDVLVTSERQLINHPDQVDAFRRATLQGWRYALSHIDETVLLIHKLYAPSVSVDQLDFEARELYKLIMPELVEVGHMNPERWRRIGETYAELGMMNSKFDLTGFIYDANPPPKDLTWLYLSLAGALAVMLTTLLVSLHIHRINQKLNEQYKLLYKSEEALARSELESRTLIENSPDSIVRYDKDICRTYVNPAFCALADRGISELIGSKPSENRGVSNTKGYEAMIKRVFETGESTHFELDWKLHNDMEIHVHIRLIAEHDSTGNIISVLAVGREITELYKSRLEINQAQAKLEQMNVLLQSLATTDTLTNLPNRRLLNDRLSQAIAISKRCGYYGALMFIDLDNFKSLNDTHGHKVGDLLLVVAANRLRSCVREMDTVARFGGDEFVVMLSELNADITASTVQAHIVAEKILRSLSEPYQLTTPQNGQANIVIEHCCTASIGVTLFFDDVVGQDDILKQADAAMYQAKEAGRNQIRYYTNQV